MADELTTVLRFEGDIDNAVGAINSLVSALTNASKESATVFQNLNASGGAVKPLTDTDTAARGAGRGLRVATDSALALAQAQARLQVAQGDSVGAAKTLSTALARVTETTTQTIRAETQLIGIQSQSATAAGKAETAMLREAQALARLQQIAGDTPAAIKTLNDALAKASNPASLSALRVQLQKTYLDTNYANSPLIGAIRDINSGLQQFAPLLGSTGAGLQRLVSVSGAVASAFQSQKAPLNEAATSAANFFDKIRQANAAIVNFVKDQGGSASFTDLLLNLSKKASDAGDAIRTKFAQMAQSVRQSIESLSQGKNPFAGVSNGSGAAVSSINSVSAALPPLTSNSAAASASLTGLGEAGAVSGLALTGTALVIGGLVLAIGSIVAVSSLAVKGLESIGETGVKLNAELETIKVGITTVIASVAEISNSDGIQLKGIDAVNAALPVAQDQLRKLRIDALETSATIRDIAPAFQAAIGPGLTAGLTIDQIRENTIRLTQAVTALGLPMDQIKQETRAILSGDINRNTQAAVALGITREAVKEAQKQGKFAEFLDEKLQAAAAAGKLVAQTFAAASSNLQEAGDTFQAVVTEGLFNQLKNKINEVLPQIFDKNNANLISDSFKGIADTLTGVFDLAGERIAQLIDLAVTQAKDLSAFLDENKVLVEQTIEAFDTLTESVFLLGESVFDTFSPEKKSFVEGIRDAVNSVALSIAQTQDEAEILGASALFVIQSIVLGIEGPLNSALEFVGIHLQGLSEDVDRLGRSMDAAVKRVQEGMKATDAIQQRIDAAANKAAIKDSLKGLTGDDRELLKLFFAGEGTNVPAPTEPPQTKKPATIKPPKRRADDSEGRAAEKAARDEAKAELRLLQLKEKEAELSNKRLTADLRLSLDDRLVSLETFTELQISLDQQLLDEKLLTFKEEEKAAVKTARTRTEAALKLKDIQLKEKSAQLDFDLKQEGLRDALRRAQEKAEEDHQKRLADIRDIGRRTEANALRDQASRGDVGLSDSERQIADLERARFADRETLLRRDLALNRENLQQREAINDELAKLAAERAAFELDASERIRTAQQREAADFTAFIRGRVDAIASLRKAQLEAAEAVQRVDLAKGRINRDDAQIADIERQREAIRLESIEREAAITRDAIDQERKARIARAGGAVLLEIEQTKNAALKAERERANAELEALDSQQLAALQSRSGNLRGLFSARVNEFANELGLFKGTLTAFTEDLKASLTSLDEIGTSAFNGFAEGIGNAVSNYVLLGKTGPAVIRKILAEQLAAISKEATVNAIKELALGFGALFLNPPEAAGHFTSAALWASLAGGSAIVGRAIAPTQSSNNSPATGTGGKAGDEKSRVREETTAPQPIVIQIRAETEEGVIVRKMVDDFNNNGQSRQVFGGG